jgi:predicted membrane channel-forming protein YqfA (hemolysin III family)
MKFNFDSIIIIVILVRGVTLILRGLKEKKRNKQLGALFFIMGACAFLFCILATIISINGIKGSPERIITVIQGVICGVWLGVFLAIRILGYVVRTGVKGS